MENGKNKIGNKNLEKWSFSAVRSAGLCEDHFTEESFLTCDRTKLKKNAVPIHFSNQVPPENSTIICEEKNITEVQQAHQEVEVNIEEHIVEQMEHVEKNATPTSSSHIFICNNEMMDEEQFEQSTLRSYHPANLRFDTPAEEEDIMEWVHLEPTHERCPAPNPIDLPPNKPVQKGGNSTDVYTTINSLKSENIRLRRQIAHLKQRIRQIIRTPKMPKSKKQKKKVLKELIHEQELHPVAKAMINLQLHVPNSPYTEEERNLSRQLYYYSAAAFCRIKKAGCNFPGKRTIVRWLEEYDMRPGFCDFIFQKLKEKISHLPMDERVCALKWDEMYIKSYEEYSVKLDQIEGLVDLGPLGRQSEKAKCAFVFCLDSLNARHPWRQPLAYFLPGKCMKAEEIIILLKECLDRLSETGADVQLLTCDQGTCNQSAYTQMGVDSQKPFFIHNEKKYNASYDFPHLVKRLASFLRTHGNIYCDGKIIASYLDFETTWSVDNATKGGSNLLSHITAAHIRPNSFEAMNVKRAFQLFSHTFAAAIKTAGYEKELRTTTWEATADFAERMNDVIDACNSYSRNVTFGGKRVLSTKNPDIEMLLSNFEQWSTRWSKSSEIRSQIPCFKGFVLTIRAILATYKTIASKYEGYELATGLCNQDSVEHLFSKLRQRGGFNPNPTARMVRLSMRHILSTGYIQTSDKGNVQCLESEALINRPSPLIKTVENFLTSNNIVEEYDANPESESFDKDAEILEEYSDVEDIENINLSNYDENAIAFFAGFVARRSIAKSNCDDCRNIMMKTPMDDSTANEKYIEFREYPNSDEDAPTVTKLVRPTTVFTNIVKTQLMAFNQTWQEYWASTQILEKIVNECVKATDTTHTEWFCKNEQCYSHRMQALRYMITVKIYSRTRYNNRGGKKATAPYRKVKNFSNK